MIFPPSSTASPDQAYGIRFTLFHPTDQAYWDKGFEDFAKRFGPILEEFDKHDVNFALEVHPTEIAFDIASARKSIEGRERTQEVWF